MVKLVDMARSVKEMENAAPPISMPNTPLYDYGLTLCFNHETLEKLELDDDVEVGDMLDIRALAKVTSVSKNDTGDGEKCRVEMQLTHIGIPENESTEFEKDGDDDDGY